MHSRHRALIASLLLLPLAGCIVQSRKGAKGDNDVSVSTPLGGMTVKTDNAAVQSKLGLPLYPGALPEKKKGDSNGSADVDMNFGVFHLRVLAMGFTSHDDPAQVRTFYRKALSQYSDVIECRHQRPVGKPEKTGLGLTCANDNNVHTHDSGDDEETLLKSGSPSRQHIVSFKPEGAGTKFGLVSLELPRDEGKGA